MKGSLLFLLVFISPVIYAQNWTSAFFPGQYDVNGKYIGGTEVMALIPHKGKIYAATSYVCDLNNTTYDLAGGTPILVLDSAGAQWKEEVLFTNTLLIPSLDQIVFTKDYLGNSIQPDTLLLTGPNNKYDQVCIYTRNDATGQWSGDTITTVSDNVEIRSIGTHYDQVTGHQYVFIGVSDFGIWKGQYNASLPSKIQWDPNPELILPPDTRVPSIDDVNGEMYVGTTDQNSWVSKILRRVDGPVPTYETVFADSSAEGLDIRGFTEVKNPTGPGNHLWFYCNDYYRRLMPESNDSIINELQVSSDLSQQTGRVFSGIIIAGYNDRQLFWKEPGTNDTVMIFGMQAMYDSAWLAMNPHPNINGRTIDGMYYTRKQSGTDISYELHFIVNNTPVVIDTLLAVRTFCISPFAEDSGRVLYSGGYHTNLVWLNNTAWVYRADFNDIATSMDDPGINNSASVFPNPAHHSFTINVPGENFDVTICDAPGNIVYEGKTFYGTAKINCDHLPSGIYFLQIMQVNHQAYIRKIIISNYQP